MVTVQWFGFDHGFQRFETKNAAFDFFFQIIDSPDVSSVVLVESDGTRFSWSAVPDCAIGEVM